MTPGERAAPLLAGQITALRNLGRKEAGEDVDWINIADARALTELGLADRDRQGWRLTAAGKQRLAMLDGGSPGLRVVAEPPSPFPRPPSAPVSAPPSDNEDLP